MGERLRVRPQKYGKDFYSDKVSSQIIYINGEKCLICSKCAQVKNASLFDRQCCPSFCIRQKGQVICQNCKEDALQTRQWSIKHIPYTRDFFDRCPLDDLFINHRSHTQQNHQIYPQYNAYNNNNLIQSQLQISQSRQDLLQKMQRYFQLQDLSHQPNSANSQESLQPSHMIGTHSSSEPKILLPIKSVYREINAQNNQQNLYHQDTSQDLQNVEYAMQQLPYKRRPLKKLRYRQACCNGQYQQQKQQQQGLQYQQAEQNQNSQPVLHELEDMNGSIYMRNSGNLMQSPKYQQGLGNTRSSQILQQRESSSFGLTNSDVDSQNSDVAFLSCERAQSNNSEYKTVPDISPNKLSTGTHTQRTGRTENLATNYELSYSTYDKKSSPNLLDQQAKGGKDTLLQQPELKPYIQLFTGFKQGQLGSEFVAPQSPNGQDYDVEVQSNPENPAEVQMQMSKITRSLLSQIDTVLFWQQELDQLKQRCLKSQNQNFLLNSLNNIQTQHQLEFQLQQKLNQLMSQYENFNDLKTQENQQLQSVQRSFRNNKKDQHNDNDDCGLLSSFDQSFMQWNTIPQVTQRC